MPKNPLVDEMCGKSKIQVDNNVSPIDYEKRRCAKINKIHTNIFRIILEFYAKIWFKCFVMTNGAEEDDNFKNTQIYFAVHSMRIITFVLSIPALLSLTVYLAYSFGVWFGWYMIPVGFVAGVLAGFFGSVLVSYVYGIFIGILMFLLIPVFYPLWLYVKKILEVRSYLRGIIKREKADIRNKRKAEKIKRDALVYTSRFKAEAEILSSKYLSSTIVANIVEAILSHCIEMGALYTALSRKIYIDVYRDKVSYGVDQEGERTFDFIASNCALLPNPLTETALAIAIYNKLSEKIEAYEPKLALSSTLEMLDVGASYHAKLIAKTGEKKAPEADAAEAAQGATA